MIELQPGQNMPVTSDTLIVSFSGEPQDAFEAKIQAGAFVLTKNRQAESLADFVNERNDRSPDGAVALNPGRREVRIAFNAIAARVERIALVLTIPTRLGRGTTFGTFGAIRVRLSNPDGPTLASFAPSLAGRNEMALILGEIYRYSEQWKFRAVGQGFALGLPALANHFGVEIQEFVPEPRPEPGARRERERASFSGTGFCVSREGYFITNYHVIEDAAEILARSPRYHSALKPVFSDPLNDLALLKAAESPPGAAVFRDGTQIRLGESVVVVGYPLSGLLGSSPQVTTGNVSSLIGIRDDTRILQITAPVQSGNSGGPLLDTDGAVVGMICSKLDVARVHALTGDIPQNINFAIKNAVVRSFLEAVGIDYVSRMAGLTRSPAEIAAEAQSFVVRIECHS